MTTTNRTAEYFRLRSAVELPAASAAHPVVGATVVDIRDYQAQLMDITHQLDNYKPSLPGFDQVVSEPPNVTPLIRQFQARITAIPDSRLNRAIKIELATRLRTQSLRYQQLLQQQEKKQQMPEWMTEYDLERSNDQNVQTSLLIDQHHAEITDRAERIDKLAKDIRELMTIFHDLGTLIIDQGTIMDRIDRNLEAAYDDVEHAATVELPAARAAAGQSTKCLLLLLLVICIGIVTFVITVKVLL